MRSSAVAAVALSLLAACKKDPPRAEPPPPPASASPVASTSTSVPSTSACRTPPADASKLGKSSDGRSTVWQEIEGGAARLCFSRDGKSKVLLVGRGETADGGVGSGLEDFEDFVFSRDDRVVFFTAPGWATSRAAHGVEVATGKEWFIVDGKIASELDAGPYEGSLLAEHFRGGYPEYSIVDWRGKTLKKLPDDERERGKLLGAKWAQ